MIELGLGLLNGPLALPGMLIARRLLCLSEDALARREAALAPAPLSKPAWMVLRLLGPGFFLRPPLALREPLVDGEELRVRRKATRRQGRRRLRGLLLLSQYMVTQRKHGQGSIREACGQHTPPPALP